MCWSPLPVSAGLVLLPMPACPPGCLLLLLGRPSAWVTSSSSPSPPPRPGTPSPPPPRACPWTAPTSWVLGPFVGAWPLTAAEGLVWSSLKRSALLSGISARCWAESPWLVKGGRELPASLSVRGVRGEGCTQTSCLLLASCCRSRVSCRPA